MDLVHYGECVAVEAFNSGNFRLIDPLTVNFNAKDPRQKAAGTASFVGAIVRLASILEAAQARGYKIRPTPPRRADIVYQIQAHEESFRQSARIIMAAAQKLRTVDPTIRTSSPEPPAAPAAPEPPSVRVVSMPARKTTSAVGRDENGNIASTLAIEQDVAS